jgi:pimeloyl-ACP methyl ester carboxylesterase
MIKYPFPVHYLDIEPQIKMAYCDEGEGETTLLFIHGLANYIPVFQYNIPALSKKYRCLAIDLPGNGLSSRNNYPFTMSFYAESVARFILQKGLENVVLVGHSMGGHVSMMLSLRYPELVKSLVLFAPSGLEVFTDLEKSWFKGVLTLGSFVYSDAMSLETVIKQSYYHKQKPGANDIIADLRQLMNGETGKHWRHMVKTNIESMLDEPVFPFLGLIDVPVLLLMGEQDLLIPNRLIHLTDTPAKVGERAAAVFKKCELVVYPQCGHFVQIEEAQKANLQIQDFLAKQT